MAAVRASALCCCSSEPTGARRAAAPRALLPRPAVGNVATKAAAALRKPPPAGLRGHWAAPRRGVGHGGARSAVAAAVFASAAAESEHDVLCRFSAVSVATGATVALADLLPPAGSAQRCAVLLLTHCGDLGSFELAQKLQAEVLGPLAAAGVDALLIGVGTVANARAFCAATGLSPEHLCVDEAAAVHRALGLGRGFRGEDASLNPYLKLLPMLMGVGSEGTMGEVARGYLGDRNAKPVFPGASPFDILGKDYQRPFELATRRLINMVTILPQWQALTPPDEQLLTQQGGAFLLEGSATAWAHRDSGILMTAPVDALLAAAGAAPAAAPGPAT